MSIKAMIENVVQIPKINGKLLQPIITSTGLKQGDNLSPILFDIFFDDVEQIFDSQCNPVIFNSEISLNHLLYADDMAILSLSQEGLQNFLNKLETYCKEWHLVVSIKLQLHNAIYRPRFHSNSSIHILLLTNLHNNVAWIERIGPIDRTV